MVSFPYICESFGKQGSRAYTSVEAGRSGKRNDRLAYTPHFEETFAKQFESLEVWIGPDAFPKKLDRGFKLVCLDQLTGSAI